MITFAYQKLLSPRVNTNPKMNLLRKVLIYKNYARDSLDRAV